MSRSLKLLFFITFPCTLMGQEIDTTLVRLNKNVTSANNDDKKVEALLKIGDYQIERELLRAEQHFLEALQLINTKTKDEKQLATAYVKLGVVNRRKGKHTNAVDYYLKAKKIYEKHKDTTNIADVIHNMAMVYRFQKQYDKSMKGFKESIALNEQTKDTFSTAAGYNMIGILYRLQKKYDSAFISYQKAKKIFTSIENQAEIVGVNANIAVLYRSQKKYAESLKIQQSNLKYYKEKGLKLSTAIAYYNISWIYKRLKNYEACIVYADSSIMMGKGDGFKSILSKAYLRRSWANSKVNNFKGAYDDYRIFNRYSDSIYNIDNEKKIQALELNYEFEKTKEALEFQKAQEEREKILYGILFLVALLGGGTVAYLVWKSSKNKIVREQLEKDLLNQKVKVSEAEIKALVADNTMRSVFKKELITQLDEEKKENDSKDVRQFVKVLTIKLQEQIKTEEKVSKIHKKIETVNKGFDEKLVKLYPELSKNQRDFCVLLRLNLSIKEISSIKNVTIDSVKSMRYRIRTKLGLQSGEELEQFIQSL